MKIVLNLQEGCALYFGSVELTCLAGLLTPEPFSVELDRTMPYARQGELCRTCYCRVSCDGRGALGANEVQFTGGVLAGAVRKAMTGGEERVGRRWLRT